MDAVAQMTETDILTILFPSEHTLPALAELGYGNLGLYFSKLGFLTLIPRYRLAPATIFPGPARNLRAALAWAAAKLVDTADLGKPAPVPGVTVRGAVIASDLGGSGMAYYGAPEVAAAHAPLGLSNASTNEVLGSLPPLALVHCARDQPEFIAAHSDFVAALSARHERGGGVGGGGGGVDRRAVSARIWSEAGNLKEWGVVFGLPSTFESSSTHMET
ncbi:hypothetical protein FB451DRAFT_1370760 [Mycena latifolia]|nr:hypothetical protein FB451DRAFT_1370760 [Mycena latifolia]